MPRKVNPYKEHMRTLERTSYNRGEWRIHLSCGHAAEGIQFAPDAVPNKMWCQECFRQEPQRGEPTRLRNRKS